jgi:APA family basic amino acid/polyamine antiporter
MEKKLKLWDAVMIVMGSMIGSGIFIVSADIMRNLGSGYWLIVVWLITAVMTVAAAISYGELSAMFPKAGGQYTYITEIFGKPMGFLYGWGMFTVIQTGTIAAVAVAFGKFTAYLVPSLNDAAPIFQSGDFKITWIQILAIVVILFLTFVNTKGVQFGKILQNVFTSSKIIALLGLIILGFILINQSNWSSNMSFGWDAFQNLKQTEWKSISGATVLGGIAAAMVGSVFSSVAWENVTFISGEIENIIIAVLVIISTFGCVNGIVLAGARVFQTMAKDGLFLKSAVENNKNGVPAKSLWMQGIWASLLCLSGQYGDLLDMISFVIVLFYMITVFGVIYLRIKKPELERGYKTFLYPFTPILYLVIGTGFCILLFIYKPQYTWPGLGLILLGLPVYFFINKKIVNLDDTPDED